MHWTEPYIGRPYEHGVHDCATLVVEVQNTVFGRSIPDYGERPALRSVEAEVLRAEVAKLTERIEAPEEGCAVQMRTAGSIHHLGVYCEVNGEPHVLHNVRRMGTILTKIRDLPKFSMQVEGYYRWI